jgi:hypothetical protein
MKEGVSLEFSNPIGLLKCNLRPIKGGICGFEGVLKGD